MSAISAGMLIYAGTVEMLGADFVFGNLGGGESVGHGHSHGGEFVDEPDGKKGHDHHGSASIRRKALAVGSLLAGIVGMGLVGLGE